MDVKRYGHKQDFPKNANTRKEMFSNEFLTSRVTVHEQMYDVLVVAFGQICISPPLV